MIRLSARFEISEKIERVLYYNLQSAYLLLLVLLHLIGNLGAPDVEKGSDQTNEIYAQALKNGMLTIIFDTFEHPDEYIWRTSCALPQ